MLTAIGVPLGLVTVAGVVYYVLSRRKSNLASRARERRTRRDEVDVASAESFPASDPPAFNANRYN